MNERKKLEFNSPYNENNNSYGTPLEDIYDDYNLKVIDEQQELYNNDSDNENQVMSTPIHQNLTEKVIIKEQQVENFDNKFLNNNPNIIDKNIIIKQNYEQPFYEKDNENSDELNNNSENYSNFNTNSNSVILPPKNNLIEKVFY